MGVNPRLQPILDGAAETLPETEPLAVEELRARHNAGITTMLGAVTEPGPAMAKEVDLPVPVDGGTITVRVYTPFGDPPFPGHLYLHGGGFWLGELDQWDAICRSTADGAGCVVASVDYRLAPEHPFPVPGEDCYEALEWFVANAGELGVDPVRVSVGGTSAGATLTAVLALLARDRGGPRIVCQVLDLPATDFTMSQPSIALNTQGYFLSEANMIRYTEYTPDPSTRTEPYASPLFAPDLHDLPPALVMTAEFDPLRDEGEAYAARLRDAGVRTTLHRWLGQIHGSQNMGKLLPAEAKAYRDLIASTLRAAYAPD
jgi:acetyl esterase